jgi:RimJ/RimL family protein N-acetyltransferase
MLKPAQLYRDQLQRKFVETWYDEKYQFYYDTSSKYENFIPDNCQYQRHFVSMNKKNELIGYIGYSYDDYSSYAKWFGIMSFSDPFDVEFAIDVLRVFDDVFNKFDLNRLEFQCFSDNPALRAYRNFIKRYGGREVCTLRETNRLMDGRLHDTIVFEILLDDLICCDEYFTTLLHRDRLKFDKRAGIVNDHK